KVARLFERERCREAVAELQGIGKDLPAAVTGVARQRSPVRARRRRIEVEERLRGTDGEPGELDEGPVRVEVRAGHLRAVVVQAQLEVGPQGAVLGLLTAVEPGVSAGAHVPVFAVKPVVIALLSRATLEWAVGLAGTGVPRIFTSHISADLE